MNQEETKPDNYIRLGPIGTIVAGLILASFGVLMAFVIGGSSVKAGAESENWPTAIGVVTTSRIGDTGRRQREGENREYFPVISYEYAVDGETFTSDRVKFRLAAIRSHVRPEVAEIVDQFRPGTQVTVYYNPEDPNVSCLEPGVNLGGLFTIGMACIAIGLLVVFSGVFAAIRKAISPASVG